jgi:uncharacterized protein (DUF3084 family)
MYFVVVAARHAGALAPAPALSLYADAADSEWARIDREAREALRLDALLLQRDRELHAQAVRATELAAMVGQRDADIAARDRNLEALGGRLADLGHRLAAAEDAVRQAAAERERLHRAIAAQERLAAYRESLRWWLVLPLVRARRVWHRLSGR